MEHQEPLHEFPEFNDNVREAWDTNADFWNERMGEGNSFHNALVRPSQEKLLALKPGENVLDIACGNGHFARQMAEYDVRVTGIDIAPRQIENAIAASKDFGDQLRFLVADATDQSMLTQLGMSQYDAISCGMAIMDMAEIELLAKAVAQLLKPDGRFVFAVMHPAFNSPNGLTRTAERVENEDGSIVDTLAVKISHYIKPTAYQGVAIVGQPVLQHYFHRPISVLMNVFFDAGFVADRIEEPVFDPVPTSDALNWNNFTEIPPVLAARLRLSES
jgi:2-polyprenyl-3-methyl-5-hydroxy-6-metoxy-1,4-benzoquinol methylase